MPTSHHQQLNEIVGLIISINPKSLLDIGVGFGKYGVLAREYLELWDGRSKYRDWTHRIDGIEIYRDYKNQIYESVYNTIYWGNALEILPNLTHQYDLILAIDVLEHFTREDGLAFIDMCMNQSKNLIVSTPVSLSSQGAAFGNQHEAHQSTWFTRDIKYHHTVIPNPRSLILHISKQSRFLIIQWMVKLVFTASHTIGGKIIRWLTQSRVSHVMIQYESDLWGGEWVAEAMVKGVMKRPAEKARHHVVSEYYCNFDPKPGFRAIRKYFGDWFDFEGILVAGWIILIWRIFKRKIRVPFRTARNQFCSELVARFLEASSELPLQSWNFITVSPEEIEEFCIKLPTLFPKVAKTKQ